VHVARAPSAPVPVLFEPMLYLVFQGGKRLTVGGRDFTYGPDRLVTMAVDLPAVVAITEASAQTPYLSLEIPLDRSLLASLIAEMPPRDRLDVQPLSIHPLPPAVLEPALRLARLFDTPADARVLAAGAHREILYRVLSTPGGDALRSLAVTDSVLASIGTTTQWMQQHLDVAMPVEGLAAMANMSVTSFHRHFKQATGTSPVNYRKTVRLHEARRRLAGRTDTVSNIAAAVGYISPSQFSRDYKRAFGAPPSQEATEVRVAAGAYLGGDA
jgi:AraC-like DNA-binding protein